MLLGFHAISLLLHDEVTVAERLAEMGYRCIAIRPRLSGLNPGDPRFVEQLLRFSSVAQSAGLKVVVDAEGEFLENPLAARGPSLSSNDFGSADAAERSIERWIDLSKELKCNLITFSSGASDDLQPSEADLERLATRVERLTQKATDVTLALRPAAGDVISTVAQFERLKQWIDEETPLWVAADVGEMLVGGEFPVGDRLARNLEDLACVYLCEPEMDRSRDRRVGQGDVDLSRVVAALKSHGYQGPAIVRVRGHSETGLTLAQEAFDFLSPRKEKSGKVKA